MGIKVTTNGWERRFPEATDWYAGEDKTLQIYQPFEGEAQFAIAEFADGAWVSVEHDPLPKPPQPAMEPTAEESVR